MKQNFDIFISYRREDGAEFAEGLGLALASNGYRTFFDKKNLQIGVAFPAELSEVVKNCHEFIAVVTPSYCGEGRNGRCRIFEPRDWVYEELKIALNNENIHFFPIYIDCEPPGIDDLPRDIASFAEKNIVQYNRSYDTFEKIIERIEEGFCETTRENATIGVISNRLASVDVNDRKQFNVICKDISRFLDDNAGEKALLHILSEKKGTTFLYERDYRYVVFYTFFSNLRRNHQAVKLIKLVEQYGDDFSEYPFTQYVYVEYYHTLYHLETDAERCEQYLWSALSYAKKAIEKLPQNNGILHCYALSIAIAAENNLAICDDDVEKAFSLIKKIIANDPNYALYYCTYARLLASVGKYQDALMNLKKAQALEKPAHNDWMLRISDYRKYELIVRMLQERHW